MNLASQTGGGNLSFFPFMKQTIEKQGVRSLYNGLTAGIIRQVFYGSSRFGLFEVFRDELAKYRETDFRSRLLVGMLSGGAAAMISSPCEVTLVRLSNDATLPVDKRRNYKGVVDAFGRILREEGFTAFYRGSGAFTNRAMMVGAVQVGTYDQFKEMFKSWGIKGTNQNAFAASMASGLLYSVATNPLETAKNRMAFQKKDPTTGLLPYTSTVQTISKVGRLYI